MDTSSSAINVLSRHSSVDFDEVQAKSNSNFTSVSMATMATVSSYAVASSVGDPEAADFVLARTIEGEVEAVEYLEVFTGCFHCKTKMRNAGPGLISRSKCGTLMKERRGQHKVAARVLLLDILTEHVSTITMFEEQVQSKYASLCAGVKYLSFGENCASSTAVDIGVVSQEEVGDPEDVDFVPARTIKGEVDHNYRNSTTLYVWSLKDSKVGYTMKWSIHRRAAAYSNISKLEV